MAPRLAFHASKLRNIECQARARDASYDQLQVTSAMVDGNVLAASHDRFAFPHQIDGGAAIQVKALVETGKQDVATTPPLLRGHRARVNALAFSPFDSALLLSGSADETVNVWKLPPSPHQDALAVTTAPHATLSSASPMSVVQWHPAASGVAAAAGPRELLLLDVATEKAVLQCSTTELGNASSSDDSNGTAAAPIGSHDGISALAWNYDGSVLVTASQSQHVRLMDPRAGVAAVTSVVGAHNSSNRPLGVVWCGQREHFITTGSDARHDRELKLWDPRNLARGCVHRARLDTGTGQLVPLYDADLDLLFVLGRGDRSARCFEIDLTASPFVHARQHSMLASMTLAAALVPKRSYDTNVCEVARVLNLSADGKCDVLAYTVPRREARNTFQRDLYPDTPAMTSALSAEQWLRGENAPPVLEPVTPTVAAVDDGMAGIFGMGAPASGVSIVAPVASAWATNSWGAQASVPAASSTATASTAPSAATGWNSNTTAWNAPTPAVPSKTATSGWNSKTTAWNAAPTVTVPPPPPVASVAQVSVPAQVSTPVQAIATSTTAELTQELDPDTSGDATPTNMTAPTTGASEVKESTEAVTNGSSRGGRPTAPTHKFKYIKGIPSSRNSASLLGDRKPAIASSTAMPVLKANTKYWAIPLEGAGGGVLVRELQATGANPEPHIVNAQTATVTDIDFHAHDPEVLATASGDSSICIWKLDSDASEDQPIQHLRGHIRGVRSVTFHPMVGNLLCSTAQDLSIRLWDIETGETTCHLQDKLDDTVWNIAFSPEQGELLATSSRARVIRVLDPRNGSHPVVAMGCALDTPRPQYVSWLSSTQLFTVGTTPPSHGGTTELRIWDARNLLEPVLAHTLEAAADSSTTATPLYDRNSGVLFVVAAGGRHIRSYEMEKVAAGGATAVEEQVVVQANLPFIADGGDPISAVALLPKTLCDVRQIEIDRLLVLRRQRVESVSFTLPRAERYRKFFQDDLYAPSPKLAQSSATGSTLAQQWMNGDSIVVEYKSLCPPDMELLSENRDLVDAEMEARAMTTGADGRTMTKNERYREQWAEEERTKKTKAEQYERLQSLAAQPSLHSRYQPKQEPTAAIANGSDSDDDWDD